jgi:hypothetical protein
MTMLRHTSIAILLALAFLAGCAAPPPDIVPVEGIVLLDGAPLPKAKVRFLPQADNAPDSRYLAQGVTDDEGRFSLLCQQKPGACVGENVVTVSEDEIPERLTPEGARAELQKYLAALKNRPIPAKYRNAGESPLTVLVSVNQKGYVINLNR